MLISKEAFIGLEEISHLCVGGEAPMLNTHRDAVDRFLADKALGEAGRSRFEATYERCKEQAGRLLGVAADNIAFLSSATEGVNLVAHALTWQPGDNVVVSDVEFPSDVLPWTRLQDQGVEIRVVANRDWAIRLEDIEAAIDERTRVVNISHVSYFTGQRQALAELSKIVRASNALLLLDATHAAGAVPVQAEYADILVSSCYKWLLGVHGTAVFYWNRERLPDLKPPFLGWNTGTAISDWEEPTHYELRPGADRFVPANPSFVSIYILENALDTILKIGIPTIEEHVLDLSGQVREGLQQMGQDLMTPADASQRAGNICFMTPHLAAVTAGLAEQGVLIWGGYGGVGRVRVSTHLYNSEDDVQRFLAAFQNLSLP